MPTTISRASKLATGINVFTTPRDRQDELIETLTAINREILKHKFPMNVSANFHRGIDAPIVMNYNQYTDRALGQFLRTQPTTAPLMKRTHELAEKHEIRWYEVADVVTAEESGDFLEIAENRGNIAVIGICDVDPNRQDEFLALFKGYGEALKEGHADGFIGLASHRGNRPEHIATYEQWTTADAYRRATRPGPIAEMVAAIRENGGSDALHLYDVLSVTRFDLND
jgi:quinol monooxygenase YgiN